MDIFRKPRYQKDIHPLFSFPCFNNLIFYSPTTVTNGTDVLKVKFTPTCEGGETFNMAIVGYFTFSVIFFYYFSQQDCAPYPWLGFAGPNL
jgi:hypothetical protein